MSLRHVLLTVLSQHNATGYAITRQFDDVLGHFWAASHQQVYRELGKLADEGLVEFEQVAQAEKPDKKVYAITQAGLTELRRWLRSPAKELRQHEETLVKLLGVEQVGVAVLRTEIERQRDDHRARLATFQGIEQSQFAAPKAQLPLSQKMLYLALRRGISIEQARLSWFDEALALLTEAP